MKGKHPRVAVTISVDPDDLKVIDKLAAEMRMNRSEFIAMCMESGMDDLRLLKLIGLTPKRIADIADMLVKIKGSSRLRKVALEGY